MKKLLDIKHAYVAAFLFYRKEYLIKNQDDFGELLGAIQLLRDDIPADSAMKEDWLSIIQDIASDDLSNHHLSNGFLDVKIAYRVTYLFLDKEAQLFNSDIFKEFVEKMQDAEHTGLIGNILWERWVNCFNDVYGKKAIPEDVYMQLTPLTGKIKNK